MNSVLSSTWSAWRSLLLVLPVLFVYAPALAGGWFWDDSALIVHNDDLRSLSGLGSIWSFDSSWSLTMTALWIGWHLFGAFPFGYHLVNVVLHGVNAFLVWKLFERLHLRWAWLGALIFAVHPLAVESVAWVSELKNTLSLLFALLALLAWIDDDEGRGGWWRALIFFALALLAKTSVVLLPAVFLLYAWWKRGVLTSLDLKRAAPFWIAALIAGFVTLHLGADPPPVFADIHARSIAERCVQAGAALAFYLGKFLWPTALMPVYPPYFIYGPQQFALLVIGCFCLAMYFNRPRGWCRPLLLGLGFFALNLLPVIGLADMSYLKFSWVADHFAYLPMIGLIGLAVWGLEWLHRAIPPVARIVQTTITVIVIGWLILTAQAHAARFADEQRMWIYTIRLNPYAWAARNNLGYALLEAGRVTEARRQIDAALLLNPKSADAHNNRGVVFLQTGHYAESIAEFEKALQLDPRNRWARENLQTARDKMGR